MMRTRKLQPLLSLLLLLSNSALAVSLGDELILSRLGDPVEIEIDVLQWEDMDLERVQISAATREEYEVFDLTWLPVLEDLNFNLVGPDLDGKVRVLISSRDPLNEPFLELLLVLRWPGGSLRREYVLLFDPPGMPMAGLRPASPEPDTVAPTNTPLPRAEEPARVIAELPAEVMTPEEARPEEAQLQELQEAQAPVSGTAATPPEAEPPEPEPPGPEIVDELPPGARVISVEEQIVRREVVNVPPPRAPVSEAPELPPAPVVVEAPAPTAAPVEAAESEIPDARTQVAIEVETLAPQAPVVLDTTRRTYQVRSGDSLWNIARQFRPAGAGENLYQMLLSIHNLNRASFVNGNISLLKANAILQIPATSDIDAIDALTAEAEFDRRWDLGTQRFDAVQRGEAIPLFANDLPEEPVIEAEAERLPGTEAPLADIDEDALIMVPANNAPQPLQMANTVETPAAPEAGLTQSALPAPPVAVQTQVAVQNPVTVQTQVRVVTRAAFAAELEAELAAMSARRQSAEAVAQQLQTSLENAQAQRTAQASLLGTENLLLASGAAVLLVALLSAVVVCLKIAGDLRLRNTLSMPSLYSKTEPTWLNEQFAGDQTIATRREPSLQQDASLERKPPLQEIEVVELSAEDTDAPSTKSEIPTRAAQPEDDLFARMDDLLGSDAIPPKNR